MTNSDLKDVFNEVEDWQEEAREYYLDMFISKNDPGHNREHVDAVYRTMLEIKEKRNAFDLDQRVLFMCAYLHDLFVWKNRKHHHILAAHYVYEHANTDIFLRRFASYDIEYIANAILEHRSSGSLKTSSEYSMILRIADNGKPEIYSIIKRIYECNKEMSLSDAREHAFKHLIEKFGPNGYIRKDEYWTKYYKDEIELLDKEFESDENLKEKIREIIC